MIAFSDFKETQQTNPSSAMKSYSKSCHGEAEGLLDNFEDSSATTEPCREYHEETASKSQASCFVISRKKVHIFAWLYVILIHSVLLALCWYTVGLHMTGAKHSQAGSYSPAYEAIHKEIRSNAILNHSKASAYSGPPNPDNKKAWDDLLRPMYIRVSETDMKLAGEDLNNATQLESGDYIASTGIYHALHCIRRIRLYLYKEKHYPNITEMEHDYLRGHLDHCLEVLREETMCSGDAGLVTFFWHEPPALKPGTRSNAKRSCVLWEKFHRWSLEHMVPVDGEVRGGSGLKPLSMKEHLDH